MINDGPDHVSSSHLTQRREHSLSLRAIDLFPNSANTFVIVREYASNPLLAIHRKVRSIRNQRLMLERHMRAKIHHVAAILFLLLVSSISGFVPLAFCSNTYTTNFSLTENPISENGKWINGKTVGLDWADVRTSPGLAYGTQTDTIQFDDSTAELTGTWGPDQSAWATVHTVNQSSALFEEVEIRLRTTISAHSITGYEINFRCTADGSQYVQIVRWNGALGNFTMIDGRTGPGLHSGDVVKATISGSTITAYVNGTAIFSATDGTFTSGSPGMGFYIQNGSASQEGDYGFTSFTATDGSATPPPPTGTGQTYSTNFPLTENPISEGGKWINGGVTGLDWGNVQTAAGLAFGTTLSTTYADPTAVLTGSWNADQQAQATVKVTTAISSCCHEVELRLRTTITAHSITGYEINCSVARGNPYVQLVRWNGPLSSFTYVNTTTNTGCANGDVLKATITDSTITVYKNGTQVLQGADSTYASGAPGIGFYDNSDSNWNFFGFSSFTASDSSTTSQRPAPPTNLKATIN